jgi:poly(3-hydroxybutyrate) depolymerase
LRGRRTPILFVMHGVSRNAEAYANRWEKQAEDNGFVLIVPHFDAESFPGRRRYNMGNILSRTKTVNPREEWAFTVIEVLFDAVRPALGSTVGGYYMYGHSAGAQFVHRAVIFLGSGGGQARLLGAIAANAGFYTIPSFDEEYPYGLGMLQHLIKDADLDIFLKAPLIIMLGGEDKDPE